MLALDPFHVSLVQTSRAAICFHILRDINDFCRCQVCLWVPFIDLLLGHIRSLSETGSSLHGKLFLTMAHCLLSLFKIIIWKVFFPKVFLLRDVYGWIDGRCTEGC